MGVPNPLKWNSHVYKVRFCLAQKLICIFFYHMILMPFLHIRIKCKVGLDH